MLQVEGMAFSDMKTKEVFLVMYWLVFIPIQAMSCVLMALPQLPEMSHGIAARCAVASSGVSAPCAHCAKEPNSSFHECHLQIHKDHLTFS